MQPLRKFLTFFMLAVMLIWQFGPLALSQAAALQAGSAAGIVGDLLFSNSFESSDLSAWSASSADGEDLKVTTTAALRGGFGLKAVIDDNAPLFVADARPKAEPRYRARFYFDPNSIRMTSGDAHPLMNGFEGISTAVWRIEFRRSSGSYQVRGRLITDSSAWLSTRWFPISDAVHSIELDWRAASAAGRNNGGLTLWIDGDQKSDLAAIDNDTWRIDRVTLGATTGIDAGTRGTYFLDAFESHRQSYIGPAAGSSPSTTRQILFVESNEDFANPERGFMKQASVFVDQPLTLNQVNVLQPSDSLVWIYFRLDNYRTRLLDQAALNTIRSVFSTARSRGLKLVIRFVYNPGPGSTSDPSLANPDAPVDLVLQHIQQLKPLLVENSDVIAVVQVGFVGHWGEWHSTRYLHPLEYRRAIVDALLDALPQDRMLQLRYPRYKEMLYGGPLTNAQAFSGTDQSRIGQHNDCFLAGNNDSNTFASTTPQLPKQTSTYCDGQADKVACWKGYVAQESRFTPMGGETCSYNPPRTECSNALLEMQSMHWSFLNNRYKADVLDSWSAGGCMETLRRRLGYRFVLQEASVPTAISAGGMLSLSLRLTNRGFAAMFNPRPVYIVLKGTAGRYVMRVAALDPRRWEPGKEQRIDIQVSVPAGVPAGTYKLALWLPDAATTLRNNPAYAVRFANTGMWEAGTGLNILTNSIEVRR
jgi:hypothetical protein